LSGILKKTVVPSSVKEAGIPSKGIATTAKHKQFPDTPTLRKTFVVKYAKTSASPIS
jgi:hypothetical protein